MTDKVKFTMKRYEEMYQKCFKRFTSYGSYFSHKFLRRNNKEARIYIHKSQTTEERKETNRILRDSSKKLYYLGYSVCQEWKDTITYLLVISYFFEEKYKVD